MECIACMQTQAAERAFDELNGAPMVGGRIDADFDWDPLYVVIASEPREDFPC